MSYEFHVGQKVACVDATPSGGHGGETWPKEGRVYTIRDLFWCDYYDKLHLRLVEIRNPIFRYIGGACEPSFASERFRPLRERKSDISIFKALLTPSDATEDA